MVFVVCLENTLGIGVEQRFAFLQPCGGFGSQGRAVEVELHDLLQPRLELPEIDVVFLKLRIGEVAVCSLFRNLRLEIPALVEEFDVLLVAIRLEAADDLFLLPPIEGDGLEQDRLARHPVDLVFDDLEAADMVVRPGQQADAALQIDRTHALELAPERNAFPGGFGGHLVGQE